MEAKKKGKGSKAPVNRASIESTLSPTDHSYNNVASKVSQLWKEPHDLTAKIRAAKAEREEAKRQEKLSKMREVAIERAGPKQAVVEGRKLRKAIAFASDL